jgi:hypothetical protein
MSNNIVPIQPLDNIGLSRAVINENFNTLDAKINSTIYGIAWIESIIDITTAALATQTEGNRYISSETSDGWTKNNIYEYDSSSVSWIEYIPIEGVAVYISNDDTRMIFNGEDWVDIGTIEVHNNLSGLNIGDYKHLTATEYSALTSGGDASGYHTHSNKTTIPLTFPTATGTEGQWAIDTTNKWFYFCIATNTWIRWTVETAEA